MNEATNMASTTAAKRASRSDEAEVTPAHPAPALRCEARSIHKAFSGTKVLRGVDLTIPEGGFAVLVGPSGCGKSTLLRLVAGLEQTDEGSIHIAGRDVTELPPRDRDVAMVFQSYALYPHLSVRDNLAFGLTLRKTSPQEIETRIREASKMLGLDALLDRLPKQLSGGQRQRVAMGRALVRRANLYLFDEPLSNLDAALRAEVRVEIRRLHERLGATSLYVTHDQVEAMTLADDLWILNGGRVEQRGAPLEIYERPASVFVATFLGSPPMNLVDAVVEQSGSELVVRGASIEAPVDQARFGKSLRVGAKVTLGVRPHDLLASAHGLPKAMDLRVDLVEALGFEAFAHGWTTQSGPQLIARLESDTARSVRAGETLALSIEPRHVHLFDPESGRALDRMS